MDRRNQFILLVNMWSGCTEKNLVCDQWLARVIGMLGGRKEMTLKLVCVINEGKWSNGKDHEASKIAQCKCYENNKKGV